jgi:hypothetical protein
MDRHEQSCVLRNLRCARRAYSDLNWASERTLCELSARYAVQISKGELARINHAWYITNSGLLAIAARRGCHGIHVTPLRDQSDPVRSRWVVRARVFPSASSAGFDGIGDAAPSNVSESMRGAELRIAETRAVNRALRKAYSVGLCSAEELVNPKTLPRRANLRSQLNALVSRYRLDSEALKSYGSSFLGVESLSKATENQIATFISHLDQHLTLDSAATRCLLNGSQRTLKSTGPHSNRVPSGASRLKI